MHSPRRTAVAWLWPCFIASLNQRFKELYPLEYMCPDKCLNAPCISVRTMKHASNYLIVWLTTVVYYSLIIKSVETCNSSRLVHVFFFHNARFRRDVMTYSSRALFTLRHRLPDVRTSRCQNVQIWKIQVVKICKNNYVTIRRLSMIFFSLLLPKSLHLEQKLQNTVFVLQCSANFVACGFSICIYLYL